MSFASSIKTSSYHLFTGNKGGLFYWHWVKLDPIKFALVSARIKQTSLNIAEYGTIIKSGLGKNPPALEEVLGN